MAVNVFHDAPRVKIMYFFEKVITALQNLENHKVLLEDPAWLGLKGPYQGYQKTLINKDF